MGGGGSGVGGGGGWRTGSAGEVGLLSPGELENVLFYLKSLFAPSRPLETTQLGAISNLREGELERE